MNLRTAFCIAFLCFFVKSYAQFETSFSSYVEAGYIVVSHKNNLNSNHANSLQVILAKNIESVSIGVGFGLDGYKEPVYNTAPIFFDARYVFSNRLRGFGKVGSSLKLGPEFSKGLYLSSGINYRIIKKDWLWGLVAYNRQEIQSVFNSNLNVVNSSIKFGLVFSLFN